MHLKLHPAPRGAVVALCDSQLLGRVLREGALVLDLEGHADFYSGKEVGEGEAVRALRGADNANLVGEESLEAAKKAGLDVSGAIRIGGVPHLQVYRV